MPVKYKTEYYRLCMVCNKEIYYKSERLLYYANIRNTPCRSCIATLNQVKGDENILTRNCPTCNCNITYSYVSQRRRADKRNFECKSCAHRWSLERVEQQSKLMIECRADSSSIWNSEETKRKHRESMIRIHKDPNSYWKSTKHKEQLLQIRKLIGCNRSKYERELYFKLNLIDKNFILNDEKIQFTIGTYHPDILYLSKKICIEFNGDYIHANPLFYNEDSIHPTRKCLIKEIWERELKRTKFIESQGWKVIIVWEHDWELNKEKIVNDIIDHVHSL
jgi:very-short-patch-repair endonuclease